MTRTYLASVLTDLCARAGTTGMAKTMLARGLTVVVDRRDPGRHRYAFGRVGTWPSKLEIDLCLADLPAVPQGATRQNTHRNGFDVIEISWAVEAGAPIPAPPPSLQPPLLDLAPITPVAPGADEVLTADEFFERFDEKNPQVYRALRDLALPLVRAGHKKIGVKMLWEELRYRYFIATTDAGEYGLNNSLTSRYARLLVEREPELKHAFELRELRS